MPGCAAHIARTAAGGTTLSCVPTTTTQREATVGAIGIAAKRWDGQKRPRQPDTATAGASSTTGPTCAGDE
jgi:hypothetical protein